MKRVKPKSGRMDSNKIEVLFIVVQNLYDNILEEMVLLELPSSDSDSLPSTL
jgi:hypothetical protein